jgi:SPOR domain
MDNDSTDNSDKRSWRERLGIGTKEMPKIANDFKTAQPASTPQTSASSTPHVRVMSSGPVVSAPERRVAKPEVGSTKIAPRIVNAGSKVAAPANSHLAPTVTRTVARATAMPAIDRGDGVAGKLKTDREAAERLAEQRVQAARQRSDVTIANSRSDAKPKFIFADEEAPPPPPIVRAAPPPVARVATPAAPIARSAPAAAVPPKTRTPLPPRPVPRAPAPPQQQMAPPRAPLGAAGYVQPPRIPAPPPNIQPPQPNYTGYGQGVPQLPQPGFGMPAGYTMPQPPQGYRQMPPPAYRPIDPQVGYAPPPPPLQRQMAPPPQPAPRFQAPPQPRAPAPPQEPEYDTQPHYEEMDYAPVPEPAPQPAPGFGRTLSRGMRPKAPQMQAPGDVFEAPTRPTRRATAKDYGQAYRELETGFDEEEKSSRAPWGLIAFLTLALLAAAGGVYAWSKFRPVTAGQTAEQVAPVVEAPAEPAKVESTPVVPASGSTKKQIYDRIVGDREVLGNTLAPTEEVPIQPEQGTQAEPDPSKTTGQDGEPLPVPPPPGENGTIGEQGKLNLPGGVDQTTNSAKINPAASESQAAVLPDDSGKADSTALLSLGIATPEDNGQLPPDPLAPQQTTDVGQSDAAAPDLAPQPGTTANTVESVQNDPAPIVKKVKRVQPKKLRVAASTKRETNLGARPVVLVPARKVAERATRPAVRRTTKATGDTDIYGSTDSGLYGATLGSGPAVAENQITEESVPGSGTKKKTLLDLFNRDEVASAPSADDNLTDVASNTAQKPRKGLFEQNAPAVTAPAPAPARTPIATGAYVAQIASYLSQGDANRAYASLKAKYPGIVSQYRPVITTAEVAGSKRYRLALGPLASQTSANDVCAKLIAAGERDCLAKRQ